MSSINDVIHFFEMEIEISTERISKTSDMFNGVQVGQYEAKELNEAHIRYCKQIIERIRSNRL